MSRAQLIDVFGGAGKYVSTAQRSTFGQRGRHGRGDLKLVLTGALQRVAKRRRPSLRRVRVDLNRGRRIRLDVTPVGQPATDLKYLLRFQELDAPSAGGRWYTGVHGSRRGLSKSSAGPGAELNYSRKTCKATIEELETSNEELQATNEELVASNEELQSTNEELHSCQ